MTIAKTLVIARLHPLLLPLPVACLRSPSRAAFDVRMRSARCLGVYACGDANRVSRRQLVHTRNRTWLRPRAPPRSAHRTARGTRRIPRRTWPVADSPAGTGDRACGNISRVRIACRRPRSRVTGDPGRPPELFDQAAPRGQGSPTLRDPAWDARRPVPASARPEAGPPPAPPTSQSSRTTNLPWISPQSRPGSAVLLSSRNPSSRNPSSMST